MAMENAFSVDVEDYYHVSAFEDQIDRRQWDQFESRVAANTRRILELLSRHAVRATFFILGWVAERSGDLVREIQAAGHEIGSHGYWHQRIDRLSPEEFRVDLVRSRDVIEKITGARVRVYRAPSFSITRRSLWAPAILVEEGFGFDSSIFPIYHDRYGIPDAQPAIHRIETTAGPLWEFPASVVRFGPVNWPVSGGGYFRLYPVSWSVRFLRKINRSYRRPFVFYVHPWELDPEQPRLAAGSRLSRIRHYLNLRTTESKLDTLLGQFTFGTVTSVVEKFAAEQGSSIATMGQEFLSAT